MKIEIKPSFLTGEVEIPASKSIAHRYLIASALSDMPTKIYGKLLGRDILATISCLNRMGADIVKTSQNELLVNPIKAVPKNFIELDAFESGSTLRFLLPVVSALGINAKFTGQGKLAERPISELIEVLKNHGAEFNKNQLPLEINGKLKGGKFEIAGNVSSQYITGLLMALPLLNTDSEIIITNQITSKNYIDITLDVLRKFGIEIKTEKNTFYIKGNQNYKSPSHATIEGDWSNACFFLAGGALSGDLAVSNLNFESMQGDRIIIDLLKQANADIEISSDKIFIKKSNLHAIEFSAENCPDIVPIMAVLLANAEGVSKIHNVERLKIKECDRLNSTIEILNQMGIKTEFVNDTLLIYGDRMKGTKLECYNDHRMAMSLAIAGLIAEPKTILNGAECVSKSYPTFFEDFKTLGGKADVIDF